MNSRYFELENDLKKIGDSKDYVNLRLSIILISNLIEDVKIIMSECELNENDRAYLENCIEKFENVLDKYENNENGFDQIYMKYINDEEVDENYFENAREEFLICFDIEDRIKKMIVGPIWNEYLTKNKDYDNNGKFALVVHASSFDKYVILPQSEKFEKDEDDGYISCSIISEDEMELGGIFGIAYSVDSNSLVTAVHHDAMTRTTQMSSVTNVEKLDNKKYISICGGIGLVLFDYANYRGILKNPELQKSKIKTKISIPQTIIQRAKKNQSRIAGEILNYDYEIKRINIMKFAEMGENFDDAIKHATGEENILEVLNSIGECGYTEVILNKKYAEPKAVVFTTTGCDFNFEQYAIAKQMSQDYNLPLITINKAICRKRNNMVANTYFEQRDLDRQIREFLDEKNLEMMSNDWEKYKSIIKDYYQDIIVGKNFEVDIANKIINAINKFATYMYKKREIPSEIQEYMQEVR